MSIKLETEVTALNEKVLKHQDAIVELAFDINELKTQVEELNRLLRAAARESSKGKAA